MTVPNAGNRELVMRFFQEVYNERNLDEVGNAVSKLVATDHVFRTPDPKEDKRGSTMFASIVIMLRTISPDLQVNVYDNEIMEEGEFILSRWSASGTVSDRLKRVIATNDGVQGVEAADDKLTLSAISVFRVSGGKIRETWQSLEAFRDQIPLQAIRDLLAEDPRINVLGAFNWCCKFWPKCCG